MNELFVHREKYSLSCPLQEEPGTMRDQIFLCKIQICVFASFIQFVKQKVFSPLEITINNNLFLINVQRNPIVVFIDTKTIGRI